MKRALGLGSIAAAAFAMSSVAQALPLVPSSALRAGDQSVHSEATQVHHKPGHIGGRGRHRGWFKSNRGKHKGWRR